MELADSKVLQDSVIVDCRYSLSDGDAGKQAYLNRHIPGAVFADVGTDLSGPPRTDQGRHPLPDDAQLIALFSRLGIEKQQQVIAYDDSGGAFAARLWWLLKYMGHEAVAVLDGGWQGWQEAKLPCESGACVNEERVFEGQSKSQWLVRLEQVRECSLLVDSRETARYKGEVEPIDPVAGHIPGAVNHCWQNNLSEQGHFKAPKQLETQFRRLYGNNSADEVVFYCGSGVTACHNLLAVVHAGLPPARLYAGSWSEWCKFPELGVERGIPANQE